MLCRRNKNMEPSYIEQEGSTLTSCAFFGTVFGGSTWTGVYVFNSAAGLWVKGLYLVGGVTASVVVGMTLAVAVVLVQKIRV